MRVVSRCGRPFHERTGKSHVNRKTSWELQENVPIGCFRRRNWRARRQEVRLMHGATDAGAFKFAHWHSGWQAPDLCLHPSLGSKLSLGAPEGTRRLGAR